MLPVPLQRLLAPVTALLIFLSLARFAHAGPLIHDIATDMAMYTPGNSVTISVELANTQSVPFAGTASVIISHLGYQVASLPAQAVPSLGPGLSSTLTFVWTTPTTDFQGYQIQASLSTDSGSAADVATCAVNVSSTWTHYPLYGYMTQYTGAFDSIGAVTQLKRYHLNALQFYDWCYEHHIPDPPSGAATWYNEDGMLCSRTTVQNAINTAHAANMRCFSYDDIGAAYKNCYSDGSGVNITMGRFTALPANTGNQASWSTNGVVTWYLMNPADPDWQNYIYGRTQTALNDFGFDGWHIDAIFDENNYYFDYLGDWIDISDYTNEFITNFLSADSGARAVFNDVDGATMNFTAPAGLDVEYSELWGQSNYVNFKYLADDLRPYGTKSYVFASYLDTGLVSGVANETNGYTTWFNEPGVRLADASAFASGGDHLELGDGSQMLHQSVFFYDTSVLMSQSLKDSIKSYYDFAVSYENLLRDNTVSANNALTINGYSTSLLGNANTIWTVSKQTLGANIVDLVNLLYSSNTAWNDYYGTYATPPTLTNLQCKMYYTGSIGSGNLWYASPDSNNGLPTQLAYTAGSDSGGNYVTFTLPYLQYWDLLWLEIKGTTPASSIMYAPFNISWAGIQAETTSDTPGGQDIGDVVNVNGQSYVAFDYMDFGAGASSVNVRSACAVSGASVEFHLDSLTGPLFATASIPNTGGWQNWQTISTPVSGASGVHFVFAVFKGAASNLHWFQFNSMPLPWSDADIGSVGAAGSASYTSGTYSITSSGADITGTSDGFHYLWQNAAGDYSLTASVQSLQNTSPWAKAGLMFRNDSSATAPFAGLFVTSGSGIDFEWRTAASGSSSATVLPGISAPQWVRLVRQGSLFSAYYSSDGQTWTQLGSSVSISMGSTALAGLAVSSHDTTHTNTATFSGVSVVSLSSPAAPTITTSGTLPGGATGSGYAQTLLASGGTPPITWSLYSGTLPPGLTLSSAGLLSGTPTLGGTFNFTVSATGTAGPSATAACSVPVGLGIANPSAVIDGAVNAPYSVALTPATGTGPFSWTLLSGTLPTGFTFSTSGVLSGTPSTVGSYTFTLGVADSAGHSGSAQFTLNIGLQPPSASTGPASAVGVSTTQAALSGTAIPNAVPSTAWIDWGSTSAYGSSTRSIASDNAEPYSSWSYGTNGGSGFGPITYLSGVSGGIFLANNSNTGRQIDGNNSFGLFSATGSQAATRSIIAPGQAGTYTVDARFDVNNTTGFVGFNLKTSAGSQFTDNELLAFGLSPAGGNTEIYVRGSTIQTIDLGSDIRGAIVNFQLYFDSTTGLYQLGAKFSWNPTFVTVSGSLEATGSMPAILGFDNENPGTNQNLYFDDLYFAASPSIGAGSSPILLSTTLSGLTPNQLYHFRAAAQSPAGITYGPDQTFGTTIVTATSTSDAYESGTIPGVFTVSQTGTAPLQVNFSMAGTAAAGTRYTTPSSPLTLSSSTATLLIYPVLNDSTYYGDQTASLLLASGSNYLAGATAQPSITVHDTPFNNWKSQYFGANANNASIGGPTANPTGDGVVNLLKFLLGQNPLTPSRNGLPTASTAGGLLTLTFTVAPNLGTVSWSVESSPDLATWTTAVNGQNGVTISTSPASGGATLVSVSIPQSATHRLFARLRATLQ